ncbi:unnamed protein product [Ilex paraguariensis]|uniref:Uncharacterized protein n=1 Tax=Ilex paraguariensis TaxID=185542 RepID=A0ABC8R558_9AQUA
MADGTINESDFSEQHKIENDEETEKPNAAIEHFDSNQEAVKTKLNELLREIDDDLEVEETGQKMYEVMNDSEMEDDVQKHLNQCWLDHHLYLLQLSSDGSDLDLGNSENDEDLKIKKQSDQENQDQKQKMALNQESVALKFILDELETEIPSLQVHLARLTQRKEELVEMFQQLEFELEKQKQRNSDMKMVEPADHELRDKIKSVLESQPKKPKTKMESTLNQILGKAKDSRRCLRIWKCWDAEMTLK